MSNLEVTRLVSNLCVIWKHRMLLEENLEHKENFGGVFGWGRVVFLTSSSEFASTRIQPSSITSAESFVT